MRIKTYKKYSSIFDSFTSDQAFPSLTTFTEDLLGFIDDRDAVCDIGAGTGYFVEKILQQKPNIAMTVIEPSRHMLKIAKQRLQPWHKQINYQKKTIAKALPKLAPQNMFVLQRCLYCLCQNMREYQQLALDLHDKLLPNGMIAILEWENKYDITQFKNYCLQHLDLFTMSTTEFNDKWPLMQAVLEDFNQRVDSGEFTLFDFEKIRQVFEPAGFDLVHRDEYSFFLRRA